MRSDDEKRRILDSWNRRFVRMRGCHLGRDKTIEKVSSRLFWQNINEEIRKIV